ncbi:GNAT family N-acetyltransferase [Streptomyces sp. NPDC020965]|uniref:GNAT family N-acetyltransferase n=1 Tax=Streptomyces sp. NPDC020965 TaxID=3365105 RepID=UPI0037B554C5
MTVIVREFRPEDASAVCEVLRAVVPHGVTTPESVLFDLATAHPAARRRLLIAERAGEVAGTAVAAVVYDAREPRQASIAVQVLPEHRGRGVGGLLTRTAEEHLTTEGATTLFSWVADEPASRAFAVRRGYRPSRTAHFQRLALDDDALPELPARAPGVELASAAEFADDPRPLYRADAEATSDEPSDVAVDFDDYDDWLRHTWCHPLLDRRLSTVVLVDGEVAAFTAAQSDGATRYMSGMTGTARAHRGRGYAKLAKVDSLRRARAAGHTEAFTANDSGNGPMLAINRWFGYEICSTEVRHVRTLD